MNIVTVFLEAAKAHPNRMALIDGEHRLSYRELEDEVKRTAAWLFQKGIRPGHRVMVFVPMSLALYRTVLALFQLGAAAVFLDEWVSKERMEICCRQAECQGFVGILKARVFAWFSTPVRQIPIRLAPRSPKGIAPRQEVFQTDGQDTALITFTTGSTGSPKAANRTHAFLKAQYEALIDKIDPSDKDVDLPVLPIVLLCNLGTGGTSVIADFKASKPDTLKPERLLAQIEKHQIDRITASPFVVIELANYLLAHQQILPQIKKVFTGGAPVFPREAKRLLAAFPDARIEVVYGSTEAEPISGVLAQKLALTEQEMFSSGLNVGKLYHRTQLKIVRIHDGPISLGEAGWADWEVPLGEVGEIVVAGPHVLENYFNSPNATLRNKIEDKAVKWHRTGDSGRFREDGYLCLLGRCSRMIPHHDDYLAPFLFENYFQGVEGISLGTILEMNQDRWIVLESSHIELRPQVEAQLKRDLPERMQIHWVNNIPRDPRHHSKIDYAHLEQQLQNQSLV